jgi:uncharacterized protein HemY
LSFWRGHWNEARVHFEEVIRYYPTWDPQMYILLANVYRKLDRENDAEATRQKGETTVPRRRVIHPRGCGCPA